MFVLGADKVRLTIFTGPSGGKDTLLRDGCSVAAVRHFSRSCFSFAKLLPENAGRSLQDNMPTGRS